MLNLKAFGLVAVLLMAVLAGAATAADPPPAAAPAARPAPVGRWETLPESVYAVFVGPDQRRWHVAFPQGLGQAPELPAIQAQVAAEWKQRTPTLRDCWPMLFEKTGAVWFVTADRQTLLRYDGVEWFTRAAHALSKGGGKFIGVCPGFGRSTEYASNVEMGDLRLFIETEGISVFDGDVWSYQKLAGDVRRLVVLPEKDENGVVVVQMLSKALWRYRQDKWTRLALPEWTKKEDIANAALAPNGALWLATRAGIQIVPLDGRKAAVAATLPTYLPGLTEELPELKLNGLDVNQYWAKVCQDEAGNVYVGVTGVPENLSKTRQGTFVLSQDGKTRFYPGTAVGYGLYGYYQTPLISGRTFWVNSNLHGGDRRICRVNLADDATRVHRPVSETLQFLQSVAADGTAYLSINNPLEPYRDPRATVLPSVVAYHPTVAGDSGIVRLASHVMADDAAAVASDGTVWGWLPLKGLCRFDGREWKPLEPPAATTQPNLTRGRLFAGRDGAMLAWAQARTSERFALWRGGKRVAEGADLPALVREHRTAFAKAFGGAQDPDLWLPSQQRVSIQVSGPEGGFSIAVDKQERIWLAIDRTLRVLDDGDWKTFPWPSPKDPRPRQASMGATRFAMPNGASLIVPLGDGEAMYIVDHRGEVVSPVKAYVARMTDGKVEWTPAPAPEEGLVQDTDGALWVAYRRPPEGKKAGTASDEIVVERIDAHGSTKKHVVPAPPVLLDRAGILWLASRGEQGMRSGELTLWKAGQVVGRVRAAGVWRTGNLVSDKPGSVWVWTHVGLQHLTADDPQRPAEYKVKSTSTVAGPEGDLFNFHALRFAPCDQGLVIKNWFTAEDRMTTYRVLLMPTAGK